MNILLMFVFGWLYANFIEYTWHRWVLHSGHHAVHNAHHKAFYAGEYESAHLLNMWALVAAAAHVLLAWPILGLMPAAILALSFSAYLGILEFLHHWIHEHPQGWLARRHIAHHRMPKDNFNIFLPVWDYVLGPRRA